MNFNPNTYELGKEYRQRQENIAKKARETAAAQKNNSHKSNNVVRLISQVLISLK